MLEYCLPFLARTLSLSLSLSASSFAPVSTTATFPLPENSLREFSKLNHRTLYLFARLKNNDIYAKIRRERNCENICSIDEANYLFEMMLDHVEVISI